MRLIDANELMKKVVLISHNSFVSILRPDAVKMADEILNLISEEQVIDAEPVRHGKWVEKMFPFMAECDECSVCGCTIPHCKLNYCFECGAKMDLDGTDEGGDLDEQGSANQGF